MAPTPILPSRSSVGRAVGLALPVVAAVAVAVTMAGSGAGLDDRYLATSWQLVDLPVLGADPLGSVWYLHVQPPLFNLVVGSVLRWSPAPPIGTLFVGYVACLALTGVLLADLGARWGCPAPGAGLAAAAGVVVPGPLSSVVLGSYEVPVATGLALAAWLVDRHLERPRPALLVALAATLTAVAMTRSLFHPLWVLAVLGLVAVARPPSRRALLAAFAVPVLVVGGWLVKNEVVVGTPTTSSWVGFNLQRGVTAPMERGAVERAVADGAVTPLALEQPFGSLEGYGRSGRCRRDGRHPALGAEAKRGLPFPVANFNDRCYLPLYAESEGNARALVRRHPGRYLATRRAAYLLAFRTRPLGVADPHPTLAGPDEPRRTWLEPLTGAALVPVPASLSMAGWNLPLLGADRIDLEVSLTLVLGFAVVVGRGLVAGGHLARAGWRRRAERWAAEDVTWVVVTVGVLVAVVLAGLVEVGENDRFRATVDPFLVALPLVLAGRDLARLVTRGRALIRYQGDGQGTTARRGLRRGVPPAPGPGPAGHDAAAAEPGRRRGRGGRGPGPDGDPVGEGGPPRPP